MEGFLLQGIGAGKTMARILASGNSIMREKSMKILFFSCSGHSTDEIKEFLYRYWSFLKIKKDLMSKK